jgi:hypothetical protein
MATAKYAGWMPSRIGEPWEDWEEWKLHDDCRAGCELHTMALRLRRSIPEVEKKLKAMKLEVKPRRIPGNRDWNR